MTLKYKRDLTRRAFIASSLASAAATSVPLPGLAGSDVQRYALSAATGRARLLPPPYSDTDVWCYNGTVPGQEIRIRQGDRLQVEVENGLAEDTTVHWHGIRLPNAMDGVPFLTQEPIRPGGKFVYEFDALDAGTFWYHPHQRSFEQIGRGLYGALIVEEANPPRVDRDITWVLDDWRLTASAAISDDFGGLGDMSHGGRMGNTVTVNGQVPKTFPVRAGERIRLRLVNTANARIFSLDFEGHAPRIIALDGQPVTPHAPGDGRVLLGPAMRVDLILDCTGSPGARTQVVDRAYRDNAFPVLDLVYGETVLRDAPPDWQMALAPNPLPEPDLDTARRHEVTFTGGMMGQMIEQRMGLSGSGGMMGGGMMRRQGESPGIWMVNGVAAKERISELFLTLERDTSHILELTNATAFAHPIHLHGHSFRVISRNGVPTEHREWQDTVFMSVAERVEIALVADNPGDWMFHCHIAEHMAAGMMGVIRVT